MKRGKPHIAVIGAGPGGLAAALLLARAGLSVDVFERSPVVGGRTRTVTTREGYRFDIGPTFFLYPEVLQQIFKACGEDLSDYVDLVRLDPLYRLVFEEGGELTAPADPARLAAQVARLSPEDAANIPAFLAANRRKLTSFKGVMERSFCSVFDFMAPEVLRSIGELRPLTSVDGDLRDYFSDERVRLAFSFQTKYLGMSPFRCPSLFTILSFLEHEYGIYHPVGGHGQISEAMAALGRKLGVRFHLGMPVEEVGYDKGRPTHVVTADGTRTAADAIVIGADFTHAIKKLVPESLRPHWRNAKIDKARISCSTFMLYLGLEGELPDLGHHTILLAGDYQRNIVEIESGLLSDQPSVYVQHAGATDPSAAPPGHSSLYVLTPVPNLKASIDWTEQAPVFARRLLERLKLLGIADIHRRLRYQRWVTPVDWQNSHAVGRGATFNLSHDLLQMLWFRPHNRLSRGVYLVGGGTHPGSGLPVIFEGARISAKLLLRDFDIQADHVIQEPVLSAAADGQKEVVA